MDIDLQSVEDDNLPDSEQAIFNVLKATLRYPANLQVKSARLADDIIFFRTSQEKGIDETKVLWDVWSVVVDVAACIPPGHPWQGCLIQSLISLRQRTGHAQEYDESALWEDLPIFEFRLRERWGDYDPSVAGDDYSKWKNLNSFVARLTRTDFSPWLNLPIWVLREALEETPVKGPEMECRIWVVSEWIIHAANSLFEYMSVEDELDESSTRALATSHLCSNVKPLSIERWEFWKRRLSELAVDVGTQGLDSALTARISDALKTMNAVEG